LLELEPHETRTNANKIEIINNNALN